MSARLYFRYGTLNCGKSLQLLTVCHSYEEQGKKVLILKPKTDTRSEQGKVESRIGISHEALEFGESDDLFMMVLNYGQIDVLLVEEVQFATREHIKQLTRVVDCLGVNVICYGLKNTYRDGVLFPAVESLLFYADKIEEIKTLCSHPNCNKKATQNLRVINGKPIYDGKTVNVGDVVGEDRYISVCREHYFDTNWLNK